MFEIVQYDEYWKPATAISWLNKIACDYIAVKHDKDILEDGKQKKLHYHIVVRLKDARTLDDIAKNCEIQAQYIEIKNKFKDACAYLFHLTSNARKDHKHEYDGEAVISCKHITYEEIIQRSIEYDSKASRNSEIEQLLYKYGNCEITKSDVLSKMTAEDYARYGRLFRNMKEFRILRVKNREMKVVYITGVSGSGKTTLAKYMAKVMNYDYFVSGSGKDVLDGYDKEECIILDDFRADVFTKAELFKLTDNNTNSSVKSRFSNKDISFCKLMIITSIKAPHDLYNWATDDFTNKDESFNQFSRRLGQKYLYINDKGRIYEVYYDGDQVFSQKPLDFDMNGVFMVLGIEKQVGTDLMSQILDKVKANVDFEKKRQDDDLPF